MCRLPGIQKNQFYERRVTKDLSLDLRNRVVKLMLKYPEFMNAG